MNHASNADVKAIIGRASNGVVSIERRGGKDRRCGADRRNCSIPVDEERRKGERRSGFDRRAKGLEPLEGRQLFSAVSFEQGILMVRGEQAAPNDIVVNLTGNRIVAHVNGQELSARAKDVRFVRIIGGESADAVHVDPTITTSVHVQTGAGSDTIFTAAGNDLVHSGNGNDWVETGAGKDSVRAGNGRDTVIAGAGDDVVWGGNGSDSLLGGRGNDKLSGQSGDDRIRAGAGRDRIDAGPGKNLLRGDEGNDTIVAQSGDDAKGNAGADVVHSESALPANITFTLINADTDLPISGYENLRSGATLDLAKLPTKNLNIRANVPPDFGGSIQFALNGKVIAVEGLAPYSLAGDSAGNFKSWTPARGQQTLSATAFSQDGASGEASAPYKVNFNVVDSSATTGNTGGGQTGNTGGSGPIEGNENVNPNAAAPTARISAISTAVDAGHAVHVNALESTINSGSSLSAKFEWEFGDSGSKFNRLVGFNAAHVYTQPGTYTVRLKVTDNAGKTNTVTQTITVRESSRRVYYVSNEGSDSNDGLSPSSAIRTWDRVRTLMDDNTEFRFKAAQTFSVSDEISITESNILLGMYGSGSRPTLKWTSNSGSTNRKFLTIQSSSRDVTVRDLKFDSIFTNHTEKTGVPDVARPGGTNYSAINCEIGNISYFVNNEAQPRGVLVQENVSASKTGLRAYLSYVVGTDHVIIGNTVANSTREHCVRADGGQRVLIAHNDLTNIAQGKSGDSTDIMKQTITVHWGADYYVYGNDTHGGRVEIGPLGEADGLKPRNITQTLSRVVIDSNNFQFGQYQRLEIDHGTSGVMVRSNRMDVPSGAGITVQAMAKYTSWPQYGDRNVENVWITSDNDIDAASRVSVGRGAQNINVAQAA